MTKKKGEGHTNRSLVKLQQNQLNLYNLVQLFY